MAKQDEKWFIDHRIIYGDATGDAVWFDLQNILLESWTLLNGNELALACTFVDSGFLTPKVLEVCKRMQPDRVYASKAVGGTGRPAVGRPSKANTLKLPVFPIGVNGLKELLFSRLKVTEPGPTYMHIPEHFDDEWCLQLVSEKTVKRFSRGILHIDWVKLRTRNEALDLAVLNLAASSS